MGTLIQEQFQELLRAVVHEMVPLIGARGEGPGGGGSRSHGEVYLEFSPIPMPHY